MQYFIGLDLHRKFSEACVLDEEGNIVMQNRLYHEDEQNVVDFFQQFPKDTSVAMEATIGWPWLSDLLEALELDVHLAHPLKLRLIAEARLKTDKVDGWVLAHLLRTEFLPESYLAPSHVRDQRNLLPHRESIKKIRGTIKNRVHGLLARHNIHPKESDIFGKAGMEMLRNLELDSHSRRILDDRLDHIEYSNREMKKLERYLRETLASDLRVKWLRTLPGIDYLSAYYITSEIGDINRFPAPEKFVSYIGLCPTTKSSGGKTWHGPPEGGRKLLKWVLVEAAHTAARRDSYFARIFHRMERKKGKQSAYVVVAHKMAKIIWHMLTEERPYKVRKKQTQVGSRLNVAVG
ncbi:hypothetical protein AKJ51_00805 [candidate division MSBL1 archaeon SCGC-AAA382A20]|uniref:Uncharacterized protein n=1 Tax=candidate division MSBL1 archaeon SCGC-AAA382A20 TaxID=1698280 RepID=A0A133VMJ3_9EURY|nr:hypothetical protein AKJ51_00805 [candidate division MSBL1 archaeon SCGC-AAA382A20]